MGLLTDYFIATESEIASLDFSQSPTSRFPSFCAKGAEIVKLLQLESLISGVPFDTLIKSLRDLEISTPEEGPWVFRVPSLVVSILSNTSSEDLARLADAWANTDEWKIDRASAEDIKWLLSGLNKLFVRAVTEGKNAYLWVCL